MECRRTYILRRETAIEEEFVRTIAIDITPAILAIIAAMGIDIIEDQLIYSRRPEVDGCLHIFAFEEAIHTHQPSIPALLLRAKHQLLGNVVLLLALLERKVVLGQEVVIDVHIVVHILVGGDTCQRATTKIVAYTQTITHRHTTIGARLVVADLAHQLLTIFVGVGATYIFIGISALRDEREGQRIVDTEGTVTILELGTEIAAILPPHFTVRTLADYPALPDVEETGTTFAENALTADLSVALRDAIAAETPLESAAAYIRENIAEFCDL